MTAQLSIHTTDRELLERISASDELAFRALFDRYSGRLLAFTARLAVSQEMAEDIVQDTFLKIWLRRDTLHSIDEFAAYLFRIAQNAVISGFRRKAREVQLAARSVPEELTGRTTDEELHIKWVKTVISNAVDQLPTQQKKVWQLRRDEGRRIQEIAAAMDLSENTVKQHLRAAKNNIRQMLEREFPQEFGILLFLLGLLH